MKKLLIALALTLSAGLLFAAGINLADRSSSSNTESTNSSKPKGSGAKLSFTTIDLNGKSVDASSIFSKNKITMINVWATYCGPCISEMPDLAKLNAEYKSKGVEIIGVVSDINANSRNKASSIVSKTGANYTHLVPCNAMKFLYDIDARRRSVLLFHLHMLPFRTICPQRFLRMWSL